MHALHTRKASSRRIIALPKQRQNSQPTRLFRTMARTFLSSQPCACGGACPRCQAKSSLTISAPDDAYEREADRMADAVMHPEPVVTSASLASPGMQPKLYRKVLSPGDFPDSVASVGESPSPAAAEEDESLQRSASGEAGQVTPHYEQSLQRAIQRGGQPLPATTRSFMESRFNRDFSGVRIHSGGEAANLARQVNARAFTIGNDVFFNRSEYAPSSHDGQHLLAHELTHVVQQSNGRIARRLQRTACSAYPGYDASVDRKTYNCAGLALRTYRFTSPPSAVYADVQANFDNPVSPVGNCGAGQVKFWLWEYDIRVEDDQGNIINPTWRDFHIVGGRMDATGNDPTSVYSKNGPRPIHGPGTGPSFKPAARDLALDADDNPGTTPAGRPLYKVRTNMTEEITCASCR